MRRVPLSPQWAVWPLLVLVAAGFQAVPQSSSKDPDPKPGRAVQSLPPNKKSAARLKKLFGAGARVKHTPRYVVVHDADDKTLNAFVTRIEATYSAVLRFAGHVGVEVTEPSEKLQIVFFNRFEGYARYLEKGGMKANQDMPGVYHPLVNRSAFFNLADADALRKFRAELEAAREEGLAARRAGRRPDFSLINAYKARAAQYEERLNRMVVQHEVAHQVLYNIGLHNPRFFANPRWLLEGLAMMFETTPSAAGSGIGALNQERLVRWRELDDARELPPIREILGTPDLLMPTNSDADKAYAQAWAMVHFLQRTRRAKFVSYINLVRRRTEDRVYSPKEEFADFEQVFGPFDRDFIRKWEQYLRKLPAKPSTVGL